MRFCLLEMVKKCCVYGCPTNYTSEKMKRKTDTNQLGSGESKPKVSVYRLPKTEEERERWIKVIPNANLKVMNDTVICNLHWPHDFEKIEKNGKIPQKNPPSIWPGIPSSQLSTVPPPERKTNKTCIKRNEKPDELSAFIEKDKVVFTILRDDLLSGKRTFLIETTTFVIAGTLFIQSQQQTLRCSRIPYQHF